MREGFLSRLTLPQRQAGSWAIGGALGRGGGQRRLLCRPARAPALEVEPYRLGVAPWPD